MEATYINQSKACIHAQKLGPERPFYRDAKQSDGLSPLIFDIFINDLCDSFSQDCKHVLSEDVAITCLLYSDDLLIYLRQRNGCQDACLFRTVL